MKPKSVNAAIFSKDKKKVLIAKRRDVPVWVIPGGAIDLGETPEEAALREVVEETGCQARIVRKVGVYHPINRLATTTYLFECELLSGTPQTGDETGEIGFFDLQHLPKSLFHLHREMISDTLSMHPFVLEKPLSKITYFELLKYFLRHPVRVVRFALSKLGLPINSG